MATSGYTDCACRDCFDTAISDDMDHPELCNDCELAGCDPDGDEECCREDAYGGWDEGMENLENLEAELSDLEARDPAVLSARREVDAVRDAILSEPMTEIDPRGEVCPTFYEPGGCQCPDPEPDPSANNS